MRQHSGLDSQFMKKPFNAQTTKILGSSYDQSGLRMRVNKDQSIPIINTINNQNICLRQQISIVQKQITKLAGITSDLLNENERLRSHYYFRSDDLKNLIQSIKINTNEELADVQHQIHLIRQGNCMLFKQISLKNKQVADYNERISSLNKKLVQFVKQTTDLNQNVMNSFEVKIDNRLNLNHVQKLQLQLDKLIQSESKLWQQIAALAVQTNSIQKLNIKGVKNTTNEKNQNKLNEHDYKINIIQALKSLTQLKAQREDLNTMIKKLDQNRQQLTYKLQTTQKLHTTKYIEKQKRLSVLNKLISRKQNLTQNYNKSKINIHELEIQSMKQTEAKQKLIHSIRAKKKAIEDEQQKFQHKKHVLETNVNQNIQLTKAKIEKAEFHHKQQIGQIKRLLQFDNKIIQTLKEQYTQLKKDHQDYTTLQRKFSNPIQEIQRTQMMLKIKQKRQAFRNMNSNF